MSRARDGGPGVVALGGARAYHIATGYLVAIALPRLLGSPEVFGQYGKVMAAAQIVNNVLVVAAIQTVSMFVGRAEREGAKVFRRLLALQAGVGALVSVAIFAGAPLIAAFHRDPALTSLFRVVAVAPLCYAVYAAALGYANGRQRFVRQAGLDVGFHTLRTAGVLAGAALLGWGALGPISGVAGAAVAIALGSMLVVGTGEQGGEQSTRAWVAFMTPLLVYHALVSCLIELDVQVLAKTVTELAVAGGATEGAAVATANAHVGFYHAAQKFAFVPYQLVLAVTLVVFPLVSRAVESGDEEEARRTIRGALRASLLALLSVAAPIAGAADGVMRLAYPDEYVAGAPALEVLAFGVVACSMFVVSGTVLSSAGRPQRAALIALVGLTIAVCCTALFVLRAGIGERTLAAAALGTSLGMAVASLLAGAAVYARFRTLVPPLSLFRGGLAAAGAFAVARVVPHASWVGAAAALAAGLAAYLVVLVVTGELRAADVRRVREALVLPWRAP